MISGIFKNVSKKLQCLDKFKCPLETIDIIKSFAFYKIHSLPYYKVISKNKKNFVHNLTKIKYNPYGFRSGQWALSLRTRNYPETYSYFEGENCVSCGEFLNSGLVCINLLVPSSLPLCSCPSHFPEF